MLSRSIAALRPLPATKPNPAADLPLNVRLIGAVDRVHYTVAPVPHFTTPPATCPKETAGDEAIASGLGAGGIEVLPLAVRVRLATLWQVAAKVASDNGFTMDLIHDALMTLLQARIPLVTNDDQLKRAVAAVQDTRTTSAFYRTENAALLYAYDNLPRQGYISATSIQDKPFGTENLIYAEKA
mgnify:CR=1 FL=1